MGLLERREIKRVEEEVYPRLKQRVDDAAGFDVPIEVNWPSLAFDDYSQSYEEGITKIFFEPLEAALKNIAIDQMGKDALKDGLKKVSISGSDAFSLSWSDLFRDGALTLSHSPVTNMHDTAGRTAAIEKALNKGL